MPCGRLCGFSARADPELPGVLGLLVGGTEVGDVAFDRLPGEGVAFGLPAIERAGFEVEVERSAALAERDDAGIALGLVERIGGGLVLSRGNGQERRREAERKRRFTCATLGGVIFLCDQPHCEQGRGGVNSTRAAR